MEPGRSQISESTSSQIRWINGCPARMPSWIKACDRELVPGIPGNPDLAPMESKLLSHRSTGELPCATYPVI